MFQSVHEKSPLNERIENLKFLKIIE
jgi:hypothetical protein